MWTHPHWAGVTRISGDVPAIKMLVGFTRFKTLKHCAENIKVYFLRWLKVNYLSSKITQQLMIDANSKLSSMANLLIISISIFFILKFSFPYMSK